MNHSRALLDAPALTQELSALGCQQVQVLDQTTSTNTVLAQQLREQVAQGQPVPSFCALLAEEQTQGRGRLNRQWSAPKGSQLILSLGVRLTGVNVANGLGLLPLLAGVSAATAAQELGVPADLKWPNDLLVGGLKLGGILVEAVTLTPEPVVVIGIGINVDQRREELPVGHATSLALEFEERGSAAQESTAQSSDAQENTDLRTRLAIGLVGQLLDNLRRFQEHSGAPYTVLPRYRPLCTTLGTAVNVHLPDGEIVAGTARDLDDSGALIVDVPGQSPLVVSAGDVTHLRPAAGGYGEEK